MIRLRLLSTLASAALIAGSAQADTRQCIDQDCRFETLHGLESLTAADEAGSTVAETFGTWGFDVAGMDTSVKPGDDFSTYAGGKAIATIEIPADRTNYGSFYALRTLSENRLKALIDKLAAAEGLSGDDLKVADFYKSMMDQARKEQLDIAPVYPLLADIRKIKSHREMAAFMGRTQGTFGSSVFGASIYDDAKNPQINTLYMSTSGLSLPDRDYYLKPEFADKKAKYEAYITDMLRMAGVPDAARTAADVVAFETKLADASWTRVESRNRDKTYNPITPAELKTFAPGFDWAAFMASADLKSAQTIVMRQNTAFPNFAKIYADTPIETLKAWQTFKVLNQSAPYLSTRFSQRAWEFNSRDLSGALEQRALWKRSISVTESYLGEALGRAYVAEYFPAESKTKMETLVADLRSALKIRIDNLAWMSPQTKVKAQEKLSKFHVKIGYPDTWKDYSKLSIRQDDLIGNIAHAQNHEWAEDVAKLGKPVDPEEWGMTPQTVNAYYNSVKNEIVFPAAILQAPFFDPNADPAVNYGAIGGVIGHEIIHGFDDQGRKSDGDGVLRDWWTAEDAAKFEAQAAKLGAQYDSYEPLPGARVQGKLTMGENIADLGGIVLGLDAYRLSLKGAPAPALDGFTGDQRVMLGWSQVWRSKYRDDALRQQVVSDPHAPASFRIIGPLRNVDDWYKAFGVADGKYYLTPEERVRLW
ncbi:M13 family metallopeptidase [Asticcacaulis machinosus]|uniref:Peptidase M13 n=1 Tax=Asticcacaulis machinosus TaxID=2984211 RepID=A0ABT5HIW6_9CAUL|nr:M13-type metalloendopeptidase [Asticcacaulis machinosus]MDC7676090.1 peptidase M13 [Asticcacaulis machinosus]